MYVMMPIRVISKECKECKRFNVIIERMYSAGKVVETDIECEHYDDCLNALEMWQMGQEKREDYNDFCNNN